MPKEAARIFLEVTGIRAERLQDISENDAKAEGISNTHSKPFCLLQRWYLAKSGACPAPAKGWGYTRKEAFAELWDSFYADRACDWSANPWVWVIDFEVMENGGEQTNGN